MRSQSFLNKCPSLIRTPANEFRGSTFLNVRGTCSPRSTRLRPVARTHTAIRTQSTSSTPSLEPGADSTTTQTSDPVLEGNEGVATPIPPLGEAGKGPVKIRRIRAGTSSNLKDSSSSPRDAYPLEFRDQLNKEIIFVPSQSYLEGSASCLPPPEIFEEALDKLLITLHPQNQGRALLPSSNTSRPIEPTLGLYCPIEGGDKIIDATVHDLAFYTGSEVLLLDSVQLAAGEWGQFGKGMSKASTPSQLTHYSPIAANALNLRPNPLHFPSAKSFEPNRRRSMADDFQAEGEGPVILTTSSPISASLPKAISALSGRVVMPPSSRKPSGPSRLDLFFESLVNMPSPEDLPGSAPGSPQNRPRLIYIRDFPRLAPSSLSWYPSLVNAVRQRRRGLLGHSSNVPFSPVTIIFGMSPSIADPWNENSPGSRSNILSLLMSRHLVQSPSAKNDVTNDFSESDDAQVAREKRLRARLRKWDKNPAALQDDFPRLRTTRGAEGREPSPLPGIIFIGGPNGLPSMDPAGMAIEGSDGQSEEDQGAHFFRSAVLIPQSRSLLEERHSRMTRRREINELTMRMGIGAVGGVIEPSPAFPESNRPPQDISSTSEASKSPMWEEWSNQLESWSNVRKIADRAVGSVIIQQRGFKYEKSLVVPTLVSWTAVESAWRACNQIGDTRATWLKETFGDKLYDTSEDDSLHGAGSTSDKVVEKLKNDPDLDIHEARLLPCFVDASGYFCCDILDEMLTAI